MAKGRPKFRRVKKPLLLDRSVKPRAASVRATRTPIGVRLLQASALATVLATAGGVTTWFTWNSSANESLAAAAQQSTGTRGAFNPAAVLRPPSPAAAAQAAQLENAARSITLRPTHRAAQTAGQLDSFPWQPDTVSHTADLASLNRIPLESIRSLRNAGNIQWPVELTTLANSSNAQTHADQLATLGRVALWAGITSFHQREHAAALEYLIDALTVARQLSTYPSSQALAASFDLQREVARATIHLLPSLRLDTSPGSALPGQLRALTNLLADDESFIAAARNSLLLQQQLTVAVAQASPAKDSRATALQQVLAYKDFALAPAAKSAAAIHLATLEALLSAVSAPTLPAGVAATTSAPADSRPFTQSITENYFTTLTLSRLASVTAAATLYKKDNGGAPISLTQLTPTDLKRIPLDPLASGGKSLGYQATPLPFAYSVGLNGSDDSTAIPFSVASYAAARNSQASAGQVDILALFASPQEEQSAIAALSRPETASPAVIASTPAQTPSPAPTPSADLPTTPPHPPTATITEPN